MKHRMIYFISAFVLIGLTACQANEIETPTTQNETISGMLQPTVFFYLNEDVFNAEKEQFELGLQELVGIETVFKSEIGIPGSTEERDVTDHSFGYSIFTWFATMEDYDVYADHPIHLEFIDRYSGLWADVKVYDSEIIGK
jgi:hypothetical protein